jgi:hypothetical protein
MTAAAVGAVCGVLGVGAGTAVAARPPLLCGFSLGAGAADLRLPGTRGTTVLASTFPTVAAARQAMAANRYRLNTCRPRPIGGIPTVARRIDGFPSVAGDQRFAANILTAGYVVRDLVFVRHGRTVALVRTAANGDPRTTSTIAQTVAGLLAP